MTPIDFSPVFEKQIKLSEFAQSYTLEHLRQATDASLDLLREIVGQADDADIAFMPRDEQAHDQYAVTGEEHIGWTLGHLAAHVCASSEEQAAVSSILARGVPLGHGLRFRCEVPWREVETQAKALAILEQSRRIRHAYLDAWPDAPHLDNIREMSENWRNAYGPMNAVAAYLFGLYHEWQHYAQFRDVLQQAIAAKAQG